MIENLKMMKTLFVWPHVFLKNILTISDNGSCAGSLNGYGIIYFRLPGKPCTYGRGYTRMSNYFTVVNNEWTKVLFRQEQTKDSRTVF